MIDSHIISRINTIRVTIIKRLVFILSVFLFYYREKGLIVKNIQQKIDFRLFFLCANLIVAPFVSAKIELLFFKLKKNYFKVKI